jgi:uncharacterized protein YbjT (DUF2867 family)
MAAVVLALAILSSPVSGEATWYATGPGAGHAAAGPALRAALGPNWRNSRVQVCSHTGCTVVRVDDWCGCPNGRVIDLAPPDFARLAPVSAGIAHVSITSLRVLPPPTDAPVESSGRPVRFLC